MDDDVQIGESERPVAPLESETQFRSTSSSVINCIHDHEEMSSDCCKSTVITTEKFSSEDSNVRMSSVSQVSVQLRERLCLKSSSGVNGLVNGLGVGVDVPHIADCNHKTNVSSKFAKSDIIDDTSSHCNKCEKTWTQSDRRAVDSESVPSLQKHYIEESNYENKINSTDNDGVQKTEVNPSFSEMGGSVSRHARDSGIKYVSYESELQMPDIMRLIQKDLSEPYSIYTYRYFIHNWPKLCFLAMDGDNCVGAIVCKLDVHRKVVKRGYIAMLAVDEKYRKRKIGSNLVLKAIRAMVADDADEVVLETEITNKPALRLYENLGFVRDKRLFRYYLNGVDALRLKLWLR